MKRLGMMVAVVVSLAGGWPGVVRADCGSDCSEGCAGVPAEDWAKCIDPCVRQCLKNDPPPVPEPSPPKPV